MAVIAGNTNVGFRTDDHGNTIASADPLTVSGNQVSGSGVIEQMSDVDYFSFFSNPGPISLSVGHLSNSVDLSPLAKLYDASGNLLASANPDASFNDTVNFTIASAGTYYLMVTDTGPSSSSTPTNYGFNVGQYTITGTIVSATSQSTVTTVTSSPNPAVYGHVVTFAATVSPAGSGTPTGTVTFQDGTSTLASGVVLVSRRCSDRS
jgi:hypothetical protein